MLQRIFGKRSASSPIGSPTDADTLLENSSAALEGAYPWMPRLKRTPAWAPCTLFCKEGNLHVICVDVSASGVRVRIGLYDEVPDRVKIVSAQLGLNREAMLVRIDRPDAAFRFLD